MAEGCSCLEVRSPWKTCNARDQNSSESAIRIAFRRGGARLAMNQGWRLEPCRLFLWSFPPWGLAALSWVALETQIRIAILVLQHKVW